MKTETNFKTVLPADGKRVNAKTLLQTFLRDYGIVVVINTVCAVIVTYLLSVHGSFWNNWVFSMCIGTTATLMVDGGRLMLWGEGKPHRVKLVLLILIAVPVSYFVGSAISITLLDLHSEAVWSEQINHSTEMLVFIALVSFAASWVFWNRNKMLSLEAEAEAEKARTAAVEKQAMQAQLQLLQAQIEPHMLFNTLANLQGLIAIDPARAQHMLDQLIHYLRATLSSARAEKTTLIHEFDLMRAYLELMSVRMGARLTYALQLPDDLHEVTVPPMLLQPLVENAIKHGLESKIGGGHIDVIAKHEGEHLTLCVADNGLGLEATNHPHYLKHGTHVGVSNVRERLLALYGEQAQFSLTPNIPAGAGAIAQLTIPIKI